MKSREIVLRLPFFTEDKFKEGVIYQCSKMKNNSETNWKGKFAWRKGKHVLAIYNGDFYKGIIPYFGTEFLFHEAKNQKQTFQYTYNGEQFIKKFE